MKYLYWLALSNAEYLSFKEKFNLIKAFGGAEGVFNADYKEIYDKEIINRHKIDRIVKTEINNKMHRQIETDGIKLCCIDDIDYPVNLKNIYAPPVLIYYRGILPVKSCIAIVGSRKTTADGRRNSFDLAKKLAEKGFCIVSGMARGIDSCAHLGAMENGTTAAILGSGLKECYPAENKEMMNRIERNGCVISEFPPGKKPSKYTFPARNRIISGLSDAVIVVEAAKKSGALITADFAIEQGRDVYAFKNSISELSKGTDSLLEEGAYPISDIEEFISLLT